MGAEPAPLTAGLGTEGGGRSKGGLGSGVGAPRRGRSWCGVGAAGAAAQARVSCVRPRRAGLLSCLPPASGSRGLRTGSLQHPTGGPAAPRPVSCPDRKPFTRQRRRVRWLRPARAASAQAVATSVSGSSQESAARPGGAALTARALPARVGGCCTPEKRGPPAEGRGRRAQLRPPPCRRLAKSTLLLIPLFGVHYVVFAVVPMGVSFKYQLTFELGVGSFQVGAGGAGRALRRQRL